MPLSEVPSPPRKFVGDLPEEQLGSRVPTAEGEEPDQAARERYLDPDEAVRDMAERLGMPASQAEQALAGLEAQPTVTREILMRRIAEAW